MPGPVYQAERGRDLRLQHFQPAIGRAYDSALSLAFGDLELPVHAAAKPPDLLKFGCR
jgi:hypothetical protein